MFGTNKRIFHCTKHRMAMEILCMLSDLDVEIWHLEAQEETSSDKEHLSHRLHLMKIRREMLEHIADPALQKIPEKRFDNTTSDFSKSVQESVQKIINNR